MDVGDGKGGCVGRKGRYSRNRCREEGDKLRKVGVTKHRIITIILTIASPLTPSNVKFSMPGSRKCKPPSA